MNQIEKLKSKLATANPAEAKIIRELIATLETDPAPASPAPAPAAAHIALTPGQRDNPFLNPRANGLRPTTGPANGW